jgi:hypothetical protein
MVRVHALNSLEIIGGEVAKAAIPGVKALEGQFDDATHNKGYDLRAAERLLQVYGE